MKQETPSFNARSLTTVIQVRGHEDGRNREPRLDQVSVELGSGHCGHVDIRHETSGFRKQRRCEKICSRWKSFDGVAQRCHELSHGVAKRLIIVDN